MEWVIVALIVGVVGVLFFLGKINRLNDDPVQKELARLIMEMMADGATQDAQTIFIVSSARAMMMAGIDSSQQQTRLAHALSMVRPMLNEEGYEVARRVIRSLA